MQLDRPIFYFLFFVVYDASCRLYLHVQLYTLTLKLSVFILIFENFIFKNHWPDKFSLHALILCFFV